MSQLPARRLEVLTSPVRRANTNVLIRPDDHLLRAAVVGRGEQLGQPEVDELDEGQLAGRAGLGKIRRLLTKEDVLRLDIAVDDAALVKDREGARHLFQDRERLGERQRAASLEPRQQILAFQELHDQHRRAIVEHARVIQAHDPRALELGDDAGLAQEAAADFGRLRAAGLEELDRAAALQLGVEGLVDLAHAAAPEQAIDAIAVGEDAVEKALGPVVLQGVLQSFLRVVLR